MSQKVRSARGQILDFELLTIKQQLASIPVPKLVQERKDVIEAKPEPKVQAADSDFLKVATDAAEVSKHATQANQLHRK